MLRSHDVILMNMSGVNEQESFVPEGSDILDLCSIGGTECYCDGPASAAIRTAIAPYRPEGIHWIDTGDYHYLSLFWLEKIEEPFNLIYFDNHSDDQEGAFGDGLLSCGSWVLEARRRLPMMKDVVWVKEVSRISLDRSVPVYVSIDKDVLSKTEYNTNWDQGSMMLPEMKEMLESVSGQYDVIGIDICGGITEQKGAMSCELSANSRVDRELQLFCNLI